MIPIALMAATEVVKFVQNVFISNDMLLYSDGKAQCNVSTLNEELGNVKYIFSDKTGTLTKNVMTLKLLSIGSSKQEINESLTNKLKKMLDASTERIEIRNQIENKSSKETKKINKEVAKKGKFSSKDIEVKKIEEFPIGTVQESNKSYENEALENIGEVKDFIYCIMLCNEVIPLKGKNQEINYSGVSPDEIALLDGLKSCGITILEKTQETVTLKIFEREISFKILNKIDFTSERRCATIIVRDNYNRCHLYTKGSDDAIIKRQNKNSIKEKSDQICANVKKFSEEVF